MREKFVDIKDHICTSIFILVGLCILTSVLTLKMLRNVVHGVKGYMKRSRSLTGKIQNYATTSNKIQKLDLELTRMVWVDLEMTGLDVETDKIMEVACIITDSNLNIIAEGPNIIIHHPQKILDNMNEWCKTQHAKTGLTQACLQSNISLNEAEDKLLEFVSKYVSEKVSPLAGNSVYMDRIFLMKHMPRLHEYLHYRIVDVSSIKELCRRWNPDVYSNLPKKEFSHRALSDIKESIEELKFYKNNFFKVL